MAPEQIDELWRRVCVGLRLQSAAATGGHCMRHRKACRGVRVTLHACQAAVAELVERAELAVVVSIRIALVFLCLGRLGRIKTRSVAYVQRCARVDVLALTAAYSLPYHAGIALA